MDTKLTDEMILRAVAESRWLWAELQQGGSEDINRRCAEFILGPAQILSDVAGRGISGKVVGESVTVA